MVDTRVVYLEPGKLTIDSITLPELKPNQVLIEAHQASVCGSERYFYRGIAVRPQDEARGGPGTQLGAPRADGRHRPAQAASPRAVYQCRPASRLDLSSKIRRGYEDRWHIARNDHESVQDWVNEMLSGPDWDRTSDLPRVRRTLSP